LKKLSAGEAFRVVLTPENAHLFKQAPDGFYKPFLRDAGKFVENVDLEKLSPDYAGAIANLLLTVNMAAIAADLSAIKLGVRDLGKLVSDSTRGEAHGAISAVKQAIALKDADDRRQHCLAACRALSIHIGKLAGQIKAHATAMPEPHTGFFDGFFTSGLEDADAKWNEVEDDLAILKEGVVTLLRTYIELGEPGAAQAALRGLSRQIEDANLTEIRRKARLARVPSQGLAPEVIVGNFAKAITAIDRRLLTSDPQLLLPAVMDITLEEIQTCPTLPNTAPVAES
jgi:hypothetical protein